MRHLLTLGAYIIASLLFGIAEMELQHTRERQAAGIRVAKKNGVYAGRKVGTFKANPDRAKALRKKGLTDREIASALGVSQSTVYRYLARTKQKQ
jgi:DNA invertase Pin-like site-specific DNA recombinase